MVQANAQHAAVISLFQGLLGFAVVALLCRQLFQLLGAGMGTEESSVIAVVYIAL